MKFKAIIIFLVLCTILTSGCHQTAINQRLPNIVVILADDLGYGDVSSFNQQSNIITPNIDALAKEGMSFRDAHSNSSVCTPTRYGLLTGEYAWRSRLKQGVLLGYSPALIPESMPTLASMLKKHDYYTACIGKWHLGLDWKLKDGSYLKFPKGLPADRKLIDYRTLEKIDFSSPAKGGPIAAGFDHSYIIPASLDFEPYCYLKNNRLVEPLEATTEGRDLDTGYTGAFWRPGKMSPSFDHQKVLPTFVDKGVEFIKSREGQENPFFLYFPLNAPHTPWLPSQNFIGSSKAGTYGDFVKMVDHEIGRLLNQLAASGFQENTLIIFASDNGAYWKQEFIEEFQHKSNYRFRGMKADIFEGGHRIPLIVKWPGVVRKGSWSDQTLCLTDIFSTIQGVIKDELTAKPKDSYSFHEILNGDKSANSRPPVIHHSSKGVFAIRSGPWKWIEGLGSGGFSEPAVVPYQEGLPAGQLYNLDEDLAESVNRYFEMRELSDSLSDVLNQIKKL